MDHEPVLISTIAIGLMAAFVGGFLAKRIGLPTIVGYIVAGVLLGPFTPGLNADVDIAIELADIGIILLMFGVGIHFSLRDLAAVRGDRDPGRAHPDRDRDDPRPDARRRAGLGDRRRTRPRAVAVGRQHGRPAARDHGPRRARHRPGPDRDRLADRRGPRDDRHPRAAPDDRAAPRRHVLGTDRRARDARQRRAGTRQGGPLRGRHGRGRDPPRAAPPDPRLERGLEGAVHPRGARHRDRVRVPVVDGLRRLVRARGVPGGRGRRRIGPEPPGRSRRPAAARRLRRPVLRVGRHAARPVRPDRDAAGHRGRGRAGRLRQGDHEVRDHRAVRLSGPGRVDGRRRSRPDRRVLVHPRDGRPVARPPPARGLPAHRRRGAAVDRDQPIPVPPGRPARGPAARERRA